MNKLTKKDFVVDYSKVILILHGSLCAFIVYTCMYAVRKPYTVSSYDGLKQFGISYKVVLVTAQVLGYMLSKFIGIKFISEVKHKSRPLLIIFLISVGWLSLFFFAIAPIQYKFIFMFTNGLPLGMIWGLLFGYLEGRKFTDLMGALLATSFIISSGLAKTMGGLILGYTYFNQWWMPFVVATLFMPAMYLFTFLLHKLPNPSPEDLQIKSPRSPMTKYQRKNLIREYKWLLFLPILAYMMLTVLRDFCEDFAIELWNETHQNKNLFLFTQTSTLSGIIVMCLIGLIFLIKDNFKAFRIIHFFIILGFLVTVFSTFLYQLNILSSVSWMIMSTTGLYMGYVASNTIFYERFIASFKLVGNVGFVMYMADAFGYLATVLVLIGNDYFKLTNSWVHFFSTLFYSSGIIGVILMAISIFRFSRKYQKFSHA